MIFILGLISLICILFIYYSVNSKLKIYVLLVSSIVFISLLSVTVAIFSLLFSLLAFYAGILLERVGKKERLRDQLFWFCILSGIGILAFFKYFNSFFPGFNSLFFSEGIYSKVPYGTIMIPIGISYYTFQALGYLIRIDRGSEKAQHNFGVFATYLLFFPKFLSGPVERSNLFFPQLNSSLNFDRNNLYEGSRLFLWGLFKKVVIADSLFGAVSHVYSDIHNFSGSSLFIILIVQTIYIYCDFSGYTDMAMGVAKCFGINLMDNFNKPFLARNISDFWRRWHISLSSWCNDFIYNPFIVKYRQYGNRAVIVAIFFTFFIVGIWHGANLTFVILGLLQGIAIVYEFYTKRFRLKFASRFSKSTVNTLSRVIVFFFMAFSMIFFFSNSVSDAWYFITHIFKSLNSGSDLFDFINNQSQFFFGLLCFLLIFIIEIFNEKGKKILPLFLKQPVWIRWIGYLICMVLIYFFYAGIHPFYYMRF